MPSPNRLAPITAVEMASAGKNMSHGAVCMNFRPSLTIDRKSTRLNSSHVSISYAVFCLKKKKKIFNNCILLLLTSFYAISTPAYSHTIFHLLHLHLLIHYPLH